MLIDEYDTPLIEAYTDGYWDEMITTCRQLFHSTLKENDYLGIDLEKRTLTIKNTVQRIKSIDGSTATKLIITLPKSNSSVRKIPLPDFIIPILRNLKGNNDYYILSGTRAIIEPRTMQYRFKHILSDLNLPNVSFHSLRHGFATTCIALGFDVKTLSEILGHSSVEITLNRYVHSSMERKAEFMKLLSSVFVVA